MKTLKPTLIFVALLALITSGCFTQFYRPGMERVAQGPYDQLYNPNDSTAIDTTLTRDTTEYEQSPYYSTPYYNNWYYWGRPRTRWGFDFDSFDPSYYWSYYGFYDYYGVPWWNGYYDPNYGGWNYPGWGGAGTPPTKRPDGRRGHESSGGSPAPIAAPQPAPTSPVYAPPTQSSPPPASGGSSGGGDKRDGRRGH